MNPKLFFHYYRHVKNDIPLFLNLDWAFYPRIIHVIVNSVCNARCVMCDIGLKNRSSQFYQILNRGREFEIEKLEKFINEVKDFKPRIGLTSTEPLLYSHLTQAVKIINDAGLECEVTTNGLLLPKMGEELCKVGLSVLNVSIDGPEEVHDEIRGVKGIFHNAMTGIEMTQKRKDASKVYISTTISPLNQEYLYETAKLMDSIGVDLHMFTHLNFVNSEMKEAHNELFNGKYPATESSVGVIDPSQVDINILFQQIKKIKKDFDKVTFIPEGYSREELDVFYKQPLKFLPNHRKCVSAWHTAEIAADGRVFPTSRCYNVKLGNIYEALFKDIWNGKRMREFRRDLINSGGAFPACSRCCGLL